jgi:hypothetical protein
VLAAITFALATATHPCGTNLFAPDLPPPPPRMVRPQGGAALATRDPFGVSASVEDERFIVRWGPDAGDLTADAELLLLDLSHAWSVEMQQLGHPAPPTTEAYKFNVYIGGRRARELWRGWLFQPRRRELPDAHDLDRRAAGTPVA